MCVQNVEMVGVAKPNGENVWAEKCSRCGRAGRQNGSSAGVQESTQTRRKGGKGGGRRTRVAVAGMRSCGMCVEAVGGTTDSENRHAAGCTEGSVVGRCGPWQQTECGV